MVALQEQASPLSFIEYNGYMFGTKTKSRLRCVPIHDMSKRTETHRKYTLIVSSYITPRRNIPGDITGLNIQANKPGVEIPTPGINPYNIAATTDAEVKLILDKLTETGKTLRFIGQGCGDIVVNTVHPATGKFVQDLSYGPHCRISSLTPTGFQKCWKIEWECEFNIQTGEAFNHGIDAPGKKILEYNYTTDYRYDEHGYCTRTIQGHLKIVPPMYRHSNQLPTSGTVDISPTAVPTMADFLTKFDAVNEWLKIDKSSASKLESMSYYLTSILKYIQERPTLLGYEACLDTVNINKCLDSLANTLSEHDDLEGFSDIESNRDNIASNFYNFLRVYKQLTAYGDADLDLEEYRKTIKNGEDIQTNMYHIRNYIVSGLATRVPFLRKIPELMKVFPESQGPLNNKICYGPFATDNVGNIQNYETADQYRELVYNAFIIPFNFRRSSNFRIDATASMLYFTLTDKEQPSFSFVPGYSHVSAHQDSSSTGPAFTQVSTTISASFKMGKFINLRKTALSSTGYTETYKDNSEYKEQDFGRFFPSKRQAYADFLKLVLQRLAVSLFVATKPISISVTDKENGITKTIALKDRISCIPKSLQCREDILSDTVSFSLAYNLLTTLEDFFVATGHGLPAIIASDLVSNSDKLLVDVREGLTSRQRLKYASSIVFSEYTDFLTHKDWLISQRYASNNARGCSELIYDRTYNRPINLNLLEDNIHRNIPLHGEYPVKNVTSRNLTEFKTSVLSDTIRDIEGKYLRCTLVVKRRIYQAIRRTGEILEDKFIYIDPKNATHTVLLINTDPNGDIFKFVNTTMTTAQLDNFVNEPINYDKLTAARLILTGVRAEYTLYTADQYKSIPRSQPLLTNEDIDDFKDSLEGTEPLQTTNTINLNIPNVTLPSSNLVTQIPTYDAASDFITSIVPDFLSSPTPRNSWVNYMCDVEVQTENKTIRHKVLPSYRVTSNFDKEELELPYLRSNDIRNNADALYNSGPNSLKGGTPASDLELPGGENTDIIQTVNEPIIKVILKGYAERLKWEVVPPTLLKYGGCSAIQKLRKFTKNKIGTGDKTTHYGAWYIEYDIIGQPSGILGNIEAPYSMENIAVSPNDTRVTDSVTLDEQQTLLDTLSGFITQG